MPGWLNSWVKDPLVGIIAAVGLALVVGALWRQFRDRERRRYYRERDRLRRDYWGFD